MKEIRRIIRLTINVDQLKNNGENLYEKNIAIVSL